MTIVLGIDEFTSRISTRTGSQRRTQRAVYLSLRGDKWRHGHVDSAVVRSEIGTHLPILRAARNGAEIGTIAEEFGARRPGRTFSSPEEFAQATGNRSMRLEQIGMDLTSEQQNMRQRRELLEQVLGVKAGTSCRRQVHSSIATRRWLGSSWPYRVRGLCTTEPDWQAADYVVVVEGEKAAHALTEGGIIATTPPGGAGKAGKADWTPFAKKVVGQWFTSPKVHVRNLIRAQFRNEIEIFTNTIDADAAASARNCAVIALNGFAFFQLSARLIGESPIVSGTEAAA